MSLAPYEPHAPREWVTLLPAAAELAKAVQQTDFVPKALRGNVPAITACILYGDEVGVPPMRALAHIAIVDGRPAMSAELMTALILQAGHELWTEEASNARVTIAGRRRDSDKVDAVTWTMDDAKRAGLANKTNWTKYPRAMLGHRATAELARKKFADAIGGLPMIEELDDEATVLADSSSAPTARGNRRRRRPALAPVGDEPDGTHAAGHPEPSADTTEGSEPPHSEEGAGVEKEPAPPSVGENEALRKRLMATYRERGFQNREQRLAFARFAIGRPVETSNDLTADEASRIIDALETGYPVQPTE